ncbi:hypothetical protein GGQ67_004656, partial [Rhizobium metallidurans]|nr:hypothetical protein [Rhizobium metallidurans]
MVNDLLKELYSNVVVPHMVRSRVEVLTIDKYPLSEVSHLNQEHCLSAILIQRIPHISGD